MKTFCIIETDDGRTIVEIRKGGRAEDAAELCGGTVIDPGPYESYEDACDALDALEAELGDDDASDAPGSQALEGRPEPPT